MNWFMWKFQKKHKHQTLGELFEKRIGTESGNFQVGQCYFFEGGALRVAKVKNGKITQIEVIRSKNAPVEFKEVNKGPNPSGLFMIFYK